MSIEALCLRVLGVHKDCHRSNMLRTFQTASQSVDEKELTNTLARG